MKEKIKALFKEYYNDETMPIVELEDKVLALFDVVGRSEQLVCSMAGKGFCPYEGKDGKCTMLDKCVNHTTK